VGKRCGTSVGKLGINIWGPGERGGVYGVGKKAGGGHLVEKANEVCKWGGGS